MNRHKLPLPSWIAILLLLVGLFSLAASIIYVSSILAFIGLGLTFWGILIFYITPSKQVKISLLKPTVFSSLVNLEQIITALGFKGKGVYLPPKYLKNLESGKVFMATNHKTGVPSPEEIAEERVFLKNPNGIFLTAPGIALTRLFEKELGTNFIKVDIEFLKEKLPKLFIEDLQISQDLQIVTENNLINVEIKGSIYEDLCKEAKKLRRICNQIGCPLVSALACALAKASGKPVIIQNEEISPESKTVKIQYRIIEEEP